MTEDSGVVKFAGEPLVVKLIVVWENILTSSCASLKLNLPRKKLPRRARL